MDTKKVEQMGAVIKATLEAVPIYPDAIQPFAREIGKVGDTIGKTLNVVLSPLRGLVWSYDKIEDFLKSALQDKLSGIPPENIQTPPPNIAVPVIESLRYTAYEPVLREMYLRLLATAMDARKVGNAHPAFAEIIRQLTPDEAQIIELFAGRRSIPVLWFRTPSCSEQFDRIKDLAKVGYPQFLGLYTSNLVRLNLISFTAPSQGPDKIDCVALAADPAAVARREMIAKCRGETVKVSYGNAAITELGRIFSRAVLP